MYVGGSIYGPVQNSDVTCPLDKKHIVIGNLDELAKLPSFLGCLQRYQYGG